MKSRESTPSWRVKRTEIDSVGPLGVSSAIAEDMVGYVRCLVDLLGQSDVGETFQYHISQCEARLVQKREQARDTTGMFGLVIATGMRYVIATSYKLPHGVITLAR